VVRHGSQGPHRTPAPTGIPIPSWTDRIRTATDRARQIAADGDLPRGVGRLLGLLGLFGAIAIGRAELGVDGDTVPVR
jgi:hypothetical protein